MLKETSIEFRKHFLLEFTKQLIKTSNPKIFEELEKAVKKKEDQTTPTQEKKLDIKQLVKEKLKSEETPPKKEIENIFPEQKPKFKPLPKTTLPPKPTGPLMIPKPRLPPHLNYLRPQPSEAKVDMGKLNPLLKDPFMRVIECNGPDTPVFVVTDHRQKTNITLDESEINQLLENFSRASKIPLEEGINRMVAGRLILSAIVSKTIGSKFIIKKMTDFQRPQLNTGRMF